MTFLSAFGFEEVSFDEVSFEEASFEEASFEEASFELFVSSEAFFEGLEDADSVDSDLESDFSGPRLSVFIKTATFENDGGRRKLPPRPRVAFWARRNRLGVETLSSFEVMAAFRAAILVNGHEYQSLGDEWEFLQSRHCTKDVGTLKRITPRTCSNFSMTEAW